MSTTTTSAKTDLATRAAEDDEPGRQRNGNRGVGGRALVVVGLDLSLTSTGVARPDGVFTIQSAGKKTDNLLDRSYRLARLRLKITRACDGADLVVIENPAYNSRSGSAHDRSGLWWMVVRWLHASKIPVATVTPQQLQKYATGKGRADKFAVHAAVIKRYPDIPIKGPDEADALVLRAIGCEYLGQPLAQVPQTHRAALDAVHWPEVMAL